MWLSLLVMVSGLALSRQSPLGPAIATMTAWDCNNPTNLQEHASFCTPDRGGKKLPQLRQHPARPRGWSTSSPRLLVYCPISDQVPHIQLVVLWEGGPLTCHSTEDICVSIPLCKGMVKCNCYSPDDSPASIKLIVLGTTKRSYIAAGVEYLQDCDTASLQRSGPHGLGPTGQEVCPAYIYLCKGRVSRWLALVSASFSTKKVKCAQWDCPLQIVLGWW